ncbi:hypothetical protein GQ42DRAFT_162158 [Ramicandelaber brevisporus]|nr:hypothetical protein GQ42DRAFT_162158 [Ramicandelaber brevisporus]
MKDKTKKFAVAGLALAGAALVAGLASSDKKKQQQQQHAPPPPPPPPQPKPQPQAAMPSVGFAAPAAPVTVPSAAPTSGLSDASTAAYFEFKDGLNDLFVFKLTDPEKIKHVRYILDGTEQIRTFIYGRIIKSKVDYNPRWNFHLDPDMIEFKDRAEPDCDATLYFIGNNLDKIGYETLCGGFWSPIYLVYTREVVKFN